MECRQLNIINSKQNKVIIIGFYNKNKTEALTIKNTKKLQSKWFMASIFLSLCVIVSLSSQAEESATVVRYQSKDYQLPQIKQSINVDAVLDEDVWKQALVIELKIETKPGENVAPPVKTLAYLFDDGETLYLAFEAFDPEPSKIRAHYHDHDLIFDDDSVGVKLDSFNDDLRAYQFFVNALGVKHDSLNDGVTGADDRSWNAVWDAAGQISEDGFRVEIAIPLNILRFDDSKDQQTWGFELLRFYPRNVFHRISNSKIDRNISCVLCQLDTFTGMSNIEMGKNITVIPYVTSTNSKQKTSPDYNGWSNSENNNEFGGDIRWGVSPNTTVNGTLNPDFSQVESDVAQLDINKTFSLFFPEKRQFFVEGSDLYDTLMSTVYTRNISDPDYGLKVTHSKDGNNYAAFVANDISTTYIIPGNLGSNIAFLDESSVNAAFRYQRNLENTSSIGTILTVRDSDSYHKYLLGVDGTYRFTETDYVRAQILGSETVDPLDIVTQFSLEDEKTSGTAFQVDYMHETKDWDFWTRIFRFSKGFRADLGFQPKTEFKHYVVGIQRNWYEDSKNWWNELNLRATSIQTFDLDGNTLKKKALIRGSFKGPKLTSIDVQVLEGEEFWDGQLYDISEYAIFVLTTLTPGVVFEAFTGTEDAIDYVNGQAADLAISSITLKLNLGDHFQTEIIYLKQDMDVIGGELFNSELINARFIYQFSAESFFRMVFQYSDINRNTDLYLNSVDADSTNLGTQLLYSYKVNPQTVFFLGYSDSAFEDDDIRKLTKTDKTLFLKMSYSWSL